MYYIVKEINMLFTSCLIVAAIFLCICASLLFYSIILKGNGNYFGAVKLLYLSMVASVIMVIAIIAAIVSVFA